MMSRSPERMSSYRRHFDGSLASVSGCQVRVSSPSPTRRENRHRSVSFTRAGAGTGTGRRTFSSKSRMTLGTLCFGMSMGLGPKLDLEAAAAENQAFMLTRSKERQEMVALNDRLAVYIEKVRTLESQNKLLESEIEAVKSRHVRPSGLRQLYEAQLKELRREAEQMKNQRDVTVAAKEAMLGQLELLKTKHEEAVEARRKTEEDIEALRPEVDKATSARIALEKQLENLEAEVVFLQRVHKEEIEDLMQQIFSSVSKVDQTFGLPDLSSALRQIQTQYDGIAARNLQEMDSWYRSKFQNLNDASTKHAQSVRSLREEIAAYKKDLNKERELDSLKTRNEYLEAQIHDVVLKNKKEEEDIQERVEAIKLDLKVTKEKIALLLREYQDLLNVKMSLEIEIITYKLIEGEDSRLSSLVHQPPLAAGLHLTSSVTTTSALLSASDTSGPSEAPKMHPAPRDLPNCVEKPPNRVSTASSDTQTDLEMQATEKTERKTLLITVKADDDTYESDTLERTFTISGAAA
uniref:Notochord granular surface n=1 Tax=Amphiprion percula TaxID=161767 RepID=A0A3P8SBU8_AMPPE